MHLGQKANPHLKPQLYPKTSTFSLRQKRPISLYYSTLQLGMEQTVGLLCGLAVPETPCCLQHWPSSAVFLGDDAMLLAAVRPDPQPSSLPHSHSMP